MVYIPYHKYGDYIKIAGRWRATIGFMKSNVNIRVNKI